MITVTKGALSGAVIATLAFTVAATPAEAQRKKKQSVELVQCEESYGTIAVVDGDTQGWTEFGLSSPRELVNALAMESGCFTPHNASSGQPADYLMNVIAGDKEEVDQAISVAQTAATEALVRSGAASTVLSRVPMGGALVGMFGGLGGKKRTLSAGIRLISPTTGQTLALGSGEVRKTTLSFRGSNPWIAGANASGYGQSKKGKQLVEAFVIAFNDIAGKAATLDALQPAPQTAALATQATVAADTVMLATPAENGTKVRDLMTGTTLTTTGKREGLFIEVKDNFGTTGWVSVESLN